MISIFKTTINHGDGSVVVQFREAIVSLEGPKTIDSYAVLSEAVAPLDKPAWTNDDLVAAVASHFKIADTKDVAVDAKPVAVDASGEVAP